MTLPSRKTLLGNGLSLVALAWIYGGDLSDAVRARGADVSAFMSLPSLERPAVVLGVAALATLGFVVGLLQRKEEGFKGYRLLPIVLVGALFLDLVLSESRTPLTSTDVASMAIQRFHQLAQEQASALEVPDDPRMLQPMLEELGRPPYLVRGEPLQAYALQVRKDCDGPVREAPGVRPGTLIYCVAPERQGAWVTVVGLPAEERFGSPAVVSVAGEARFLLVRPIPPDEAEPGTAFRDNPAAPPSPAGDTDAGTPLAGP
ncbi:hypothetical protein [Corallococcus macrosporus]|uniref:Uncharacterized protein n=1 Tax=Corallococcus macrosporus DSM 14697 TaxID=1189310 RepID=A0A250K397_9BACT|nr:hypothetical protein [Corallococcus macrosporus]ATB49836.1 hypothetical protein MYMAC_005490 [Corallococcus macrosporus DSM 14697]